MMGRSGEEGRSGGAVYTTASVPIYWAGAVTQKLLAFSWAGAVSPPLWGLGGAGAVGGGQGQSGVPYTQQLQSHVVGQGQ